jgi:hypothetical protein
MQKKIQKYKFSRNLLKADVKFEKIIKKNGIFRPRIKYYELEYYFPSWRDVKLKNKRIYKIVKELTSLAFPDSFDEFDKRWFSFYLLLKRNGRLIAFPISVMEYKRRFFVHFKDFGNVEISKGNEKCEDFWLNVFEDILKFAKLMREKSNEELKEILERIVPYDIRTGNILGKYIMKKNNA